MADDLNKFGSIFEDAYNQSEEFKKYFNSLIDEMTKHFKESIGAMGRELTEEESKQLRQRKENTEKQVRDTVNAENRLKQHQQQLKLNADNAKADLYEAQQSRDKNKIKQAQDKYKQATRNQKEFENAGISSTTVASKISGITGVVNTAIQGSGTTGMAWLGDLATQGLGAIGGAIAGPIGQAVGQSVGKIANTFIKIWVERMDRLSKLLDNNIKQTNEILQVNYSKIATRLQGTDIRMEDIITKLAANIGEVNEEAGKTMVSYIMSGKNYIENVTKLAEAGIAYNLEERAMLMTISDKIAASFETLDKNLTRLVRIQQSDLTATALGAEAALTSFLNTYYTDSSYVGDKYSSVTSTLFEATSQMNTDQATSFAYAVQKWLGALYSVGLSGEAVDLIAKGLTYLSTGDISQLGSDTSLQTMMALASQKAGISYADLLTGGLDAENVDSLMTSMVDYLSAIANNTSNQVVKSEWSNIFGLSLSDLRAIANLTANDIKTLQGGNLGYQEALLETQKQIGAITSRLSAQEAVNTMIENIGLLRGLSISTDETAYWDWALEQFTKERAASTSWNKLGFFLQDLFRLEDVESAGKYILGSETDVLRNSWDWGFANNRNLDYLDLYEKLTLQLFRNWGGTQTYGASRGSNYIGYSPNVSGDIADLLRDTIENNPSATPGVKQTLSSSNFNAVSGAENIINSFDQTESAVQAQSEDIIGTNEEITETLDKLYNMLFEAQTTPIKVNIDTASDEFVKLLTDILTNNTDKLSTDIESIITSSTDYAGSLINSLNLVRGS